MKKTRQMMTIFISTLALVACTPPEVEMEVGTNDESQVTDNENESVSEQGTEEVDSNDNETEDQDEPMDNQETADDDETGELDLVVSHAFEENNQTPENNDLLAVVDDTLQTNPDLGDPDDISLTYTGNYTENNVVYGIFILVNRTEYTVNDLTLSLDWAYNDEPILEDFQINYWAEEMNTLPPNSAITVLIPVENDKVDIAQQIENIEDMSLNINTIEILDYN